MNLKPPSRVSRTIRRIRQMFWPKAIVLIYHRAADLTVDPYLQAVSPANFAQQLEVLQQKFHVCTLAELAAGLDQGRLPNRCLAITFDDGYADSLHDAQPLLEQFGLPATFFIVSGRIGQDGEYWWDELEGLLLWPGTLPPSCRIMIGDGLIELDLGASAIYSDQDFAQYSSWQAFQTGDPTPRHILYRRLHEAIWGLDDRSREEAMIAVRTWAGAEAKNRPTQRSLSLNELQELSGKDGVDIGAHTVSHPLLSALPVEEQKQEIVASKKSLEALLDRPVNAFSYPYGHRAAYSEKTTGLVRDAGFSLACSGFKGRIWPDCDPYQLPRFLVGNWDGDTFGRQLDQWFNG